MIKTEKAILVDNLIQELKTSNSLVLVDFTHLTVKKQQELKSRLSAIGTRMLVVKNTLFKRAGEAAKVNPEILTDTILSGPTAAILTNEDPLAALTVINNFAKEFEVPQFKVGIIENQFRDKDSLLKLAALPGKNVLFAQVIGALSSPLYSLVGTLNGNLEKLVYILKSKSG